MHTIDESIRLIKTARTVELMAFSRDGDPLAMVPIGRPEALTLIAMPVTMGHVFRASHVGEDGCSWRRLEAFSAFESSCTNPVPRTVCRVSHGTKKP